jgi:hypothetical protein
MKRILYAAIAGGLALQLWSAFSTAVLPWPAQASGRLPPPTLTASYAFSVERSEGEPDESLKSPIGRTSPAPEPLVQSDSTPPSAFSRATVVHVDWETYMLGLGMDLAIGLLAALAVLAMPEQTHWSRKLAFLLIGGAFAVLLGDLSQAWAMHWPLRYSALVCVDHFGAVLCVAAASFLAMRWSRRPDGLGGSGAAGAAGPS